MISDTDATALFNEGRLGAAIESATASVRGRPADPAPRLLLAELLLFRGDYARVETLLAAAAGLSPDLAVVIAETRQLLRATVARDACATEGAVPGFLGEPTEAQSHALRILVALRAGDAGEAAAAAEALEQTRPRVAGMAELAAAAGEPTRTFRFEDFRDADDVLAGTIEVLTTTGVYYWVPTERILSMELHPVRRPRDLFWRRCTMAVEAGPEGEVYLPVCYRAEPDASDAIRLARETDWTEAPPIRGRGQRLFLAGEEALAFCAIERLAFGAEAG